MTEQSQNLNSLENPGNTESISTSSLNPQDDPPKTLFLLLLVLLVIVFAVLGYIFTFGKKKNTNSAIISPTPIISNLPPTLKLGITTNWNIFKSNYAYQLKYPEKWIVYQQSLYEENNYYVLQYDNEAILRFREPEQLYGITISLKKPLLTFNP